MTKGATPAVPSSGIRNLILICALPLAACGGVLDPQGPVGISQRLVLFDSLAIMLAIVVPVILATAGVVFWFRAANKRAEYWPDWAFSGRLEVLVWSIPAIVITFLGGIAWFGSHALDPYRPLSGGAPALEVEVVSLDWKWLFIYPADGVAAVNQLVLPVGMPVHFRLTSTGVMNSFFVPQLGSQMYAMAGMTSQLHLQADRPGLYRGLSAQFSGEGFADMRFDVRAVTPENFQKWIAEAKSRGATLDAAAYAALEKPSRNVASATYKSVEPKLFDTIVRDSMQQPRQESR
ncbi:MAG: ubiquinol oxidase subunit II [Pseudolabrys sp.]|nr:ubiquinol oxidase subunit II [Pseudolabrys sp.]